MNKEEWTATISDEARAAGFSVSEHEGFPVIDTPAGFDDKLKLLRLEFSMPLSRTIYREGMLLTPTDPSVRFEGCHDDNYLQSITWFPDSPDAGEPGCFCSYCKKLIEAKDAPAIRIYKRKGMEARFHRPCFIQFEKENTNGPQTQPSL